MLSEPRTSTALERNFANPSRAFVLVAHTHTHTHTHTRTSESTFLSFITRYSSPIIWRARTYCVTLTPGRLQQPLNLIFSRKRAAKRIAACPSVVRTTASSSIRQWSLQRRCVPFLTITSLLKWTSSYRKINPLRVVRIFSATNAKKGKRFRCEFVLRMWPISCRYASATACKTWMESPVSLTWSISSSRSPCWMTYGIASLWRGTKTTDLCRWKKEKKREQPDARDFALSKNGWWRVACLLSEYRCCCKMTNFGRQGTRSCLSLSDFFIPFLHFCAMRNCPMIK